MKHQSGSACDTINEANVREAVARAELAELQLAREKQFLGGPEAQSHAADTETADGTRRIFARDLIDEETECLKRVMTEALEKTAPEPMHAVAMRKRETMSEIAHRLANTAASEVEQGVANGEIAFRFGDVGVFIRIGERRAANEERI
ncbi:hypothetical protein FGG78_19845 [Thioclava sp. BHET1]|nr:hypothetical protein FGG78_19845 [Thioclava sp. BHET1]